MFLPGAGWKICSAGDTGECFTDRDILTRLNHAFGFRITFSVR